MSSKKEPSCKPMRIPDTYVIIFFVVLLAAILTYTVPVGTYKTHEITYEVDGATKTKNVLVPDSFELKRDEQGNPVKQG
ncbi:MAG: hypothetical protein EOM02_12355, partial [Synergistales bacterium]|nr:hypothetical protein [Synergistales bacterium]